MLTSPKTFVSYASEDRVFALGLVMELRMAGADLWVDTLDIPAGTPWDDQIDAALKACPQMLLVLSPASMKSQNVRDEMAFALKRNRLIVPVLYKDCDDDIPYRIQRLQHVDLRGKSEYSVGQVLRALNVPVRPMPLLSSTLGIAPGPKDEPALPGLGVFSDARRLSREGGHAAPSGTEPASAKPAGPALGGPRLLSWLSPEQEKDLLSGAAGKPGSTTPTPWRWPAIGAPGDAEPVPRKPKRKRP